MVPVDSGRVVALRSVAVVVSDLEIVNVVQLRLERGARRCPPLREVEVAELLGDDVLDLALACGQRRPTEAALTPVTPGQVTK